MFLFILAVILVAGCTCQHAPGNLLREWQKQQERSWEKNNFTNIQDIKEKINAVNKNMNNEWKKLEISINSIDSKLISIAHSLTRIENYLKNFLISFDIIFGISKGIAFGIFLNTLRAINDSFDKN